MKTVIYVNILHTLVYCGVEVTSCGTLGQACPVQVHTHWLESVWIVAETRQIHYPVCHGTITYHLAERFTRVYFTIDPVSQNTHQQFACSVNVGVLLCVHYYLNLQTTLFVYTATTKSFINGYTYSDVYKVY